MKLAESDNQVSEYSAKKSAIRGSVAEAEASSKIAVVAPAQGRIDNISVTTGQIVNAGDSLVQITPGNEKNLRLIIWLPNTAIPWIKTGDAINVRYDAFPYQKYGQFPGTVLAFPACRQRQMN